VVFQDRGPEVDPCVPTGDNQTEVLGISKARRNRIGSNAEYALGPTTRIPRSLKLAAAY
jgi:hypothetical protein